MSPAQPTEAKFRNGAWLLQQLRDLGPYARMLDTEILPRGTAKEIRAACADLMAATFPPAKEPEDYIIGGADHALALGEPCQPFAFLPRNEAKTITDDGTIWPIARDEMVQTQPIRARMAEDMAALVRANAGAVFTTDDFLRLGWRREQLDRHRQAAMDMFNGEGSCGNTRNRDNANEVA